MMGNESVVEECGGQEETMSCIWFTYGSAIRRVSDEPESYVRTVCAIEALDSLECYLLFPVFWMTLLILLNCKDKT